MYSMRSSEAFETQVLPELNRRAALAVLGMKPINGRGDPVKKGAISAEEALRYAMSLPVTTTITGMEKPEVLTQNTEIAQHFQKMSAEEMAALRTRVRDLAGWPFRTLQSLTEIRQPGGPPSHDFPLDMKQKEVQEMVNPANTGDAFPKPAQW